MKTSAQREYWLRITELATYKTITFEQFKNEAKNIAVEIAKSFVATDKEVGEIINDLDKINLKQFNYEGCKIIF